MFGLGSLDILKHGCDLGFFHCSFTLVCIYPFASSRFSCISSMSFCTIFTLPTFQNVHTSYQRDSFFLCLLILNNARSSQSMRLVRTYISCSLQYHFHFTEYQLEFLDPRPNPAAGIQTAPLNMRFKHTALISFSPPSHLTFHSRCTVQSTS